MMQDIFDPILSEEELAKWFDTSRPTLQRQRSEGTGPPFIQLSERRIGYRKSTVEQWLEARTINRVGALTSSAQSLEPADTPAPAPFDDAKTATKVEPPSARRVGRAGT